MVTSLPIPVPDRATVTREESGSFEVILKYASCAPEAVGVKVMARVQEVPNGIVGVVLAQGFGPPGATENMDEDVPVNLSG